MNEAFKSNISVPKGRIEMCLAIPAEILEISGDEAIADFGGVRRKIIVTLIDNIKVGDYVIVHTGYAISKLSKKDAAESLKLWDEVFEIIDKDLNKSTTHTSRRDSSRRDQIEA